MGLTFIASVTASSSATLSFTSGIDSTYNEYLFQFVNMHPATDGAHIEFQFNASAGSGFNETITSTAFRANHTEDGSSSALAYQTSRDQAQGTGYQDLVAGVGNDNDQSTSGILTLYDPASTTYVKHFMSRGVMSHDDQHIMDYYIAGYVNTTSAIDEISFSTDGGNIDAGTIYMYGVS